MSKRLNLQIKRITAFFKSRGFDITLSKYKSQHEDYEEFTHVIQAKGETDGLLDLLDQVFSEVIVWPDDWTEENRKGTYCVRIHEDFTICRQCGCSDNNACDGGCWWVEEDLCSSCYYGSEEKMEVGHA